MNKKILSHLFLSLACFTLAPSLCHALPKDPKVASGKAKIESIDSQTMEIRASDQTIINYSKFDIGKKEKVRFIQDSSSSCVLNRVHSQDPSQILGSLESNGKVFLVNPKGIYFGPESKVNVGSLIASTLNIEDGDFLKENYSFTLNNDKLSSIRNEGSLIAHEGSIVLMAPQIHNTGLIDAKAGSVLLASGEHITLDFMGDGLLQFSVEGSLKEALIEHLGEIKGSTISMKLPVAKKAISEIVNMDGAEEGEVFIEENGIIKLSSSSSLIADKVLIEGANLELEGNIDVSSQTQKGGDVHLFGTEISLKEATIDASGALGGGEVLIGGEYQGRGKTPYASIVTMDATSKISASALGKGDGGLVVLWSQEKTTFDGYIEAKGGSLGGNGGLIESSSQGGLQVSKARVDTLSPYGKVGDWLLDPSQMVIGTTGTGTCSCLQTGSAFGDCAHINPCSTSNNCFVLASTLEASQSNVTLQATTLIIFSVANLTMQFPNIGITVLGNCPASSCSFDLPSPEIPCTLAFVGIFPDQATDSFPNPLFPPIPGPVTITTQGGDFSISTVGVVVTNPWTIDTIGGGVYPGGNVNLLGAFASPALSLDPVGVTIIAGSGVVTASTQVSGFIDDGVPAYTLIDYFSVESASQVNSYSLKTNGTSSDEGISINAPLYITSSTAFIISTNGAPISLASVDWGEGLTAYPLTVAAEGGAVTLGDIGGSNPPTSLIVSSSTSVSLADIHLNGGNIQIISPEILIHQDATISSGGGSINFSSSIGSTPAGVQSLIVDAGSNSLSISVGNLKNLTLIASTINPPGAINIAGALTLTATAALNITSGDISAFSVSENGGGTVTLGNNITATSSTLSFVDDITLTQGVDLTALTTLNLANVFGSGSQTLDLTSYAGSIVVGQLGTTANPLSATTLTANGQSSALGIVTAGQAIDIRPPISLTSSSTIFDSTSNGAFSGNTIRFQNTVDATTSGVQGLTVKAGNGNVTFENNVGANRSLAFLTVTGTSPAVVNVGGSITTTGTIEIQPNITLIGNSIITTTAGGDIDLNAVEGSWSLSIVNSGLLAITESITVGSFSQGGGGEVHLGNNITTTIGTLSFAHEITLTSNVTLSSFGQMTLSSDVLGAYPLILSSSNLVSAAHLGTSTSPIESLSLSAPIASSSFLGIAVTEGIDITAPIQLITSPTIIEVVGSGSSSNSFTFRNNINAATPGSQSLEIDAGSNQVVLGASVGNLIPLGDVTIDASSLYLSNIRTYGAPIDITATTYLNATAVTLDTSSLSGGDIDFTGAILASSSPQSLTLLAGTNGVITFSDDIGPIEALTISSGSDVHIKNVTVNSNIAITPHETLSINGETSFVSTSGGSILLGPIDGTTNGAQSLSVETTGAVGLGTIGESVFLGTVEVLTGTSASIESIFTDGEITITPPITLASSSVLNSTDADITLASVDGTVSGEQSLSIVAGSGDVTLTGDVGALIPPGSLSMQAALIHFEGSKVYGAGTHIYQGPVLVDQTIGFRSLGNMTFESTVDTSSSAFPNLGLFLGGGTLTFMGSVGDAPFGIVAVYNAGSFSAQDILASDLIVGGGLPSIYLNGPITLSGRGGIILDGGPIHLGGEIEASRIWFRSQGDISNIGSPQSLTLTGDSPGLFEYLNAIKGVIGSSSSPIDLNISKTLLLGASPSADFTGDAERLSFKAIPSNRPCIVTYNGITILNDLNCLNPDSIQNIFNSLSKNLFYAPGIYSFWSWDNLSNPWYFSGEAFALGENPRDRTLFYRETLLYRTNPLAEHSVLQFGGSIPHQEKVEVDTMEILPKEESLKLPIKNLLFESFEESKEKNFDFKIDEFPFIYMTSEIIEQPYFRREPTQEDMDFEFSVEFAEETSFLKLHLK